jgi:RNA polymerase sigma-54 factor
MGIDLRLTLSQRLVMTPQLQQAIKLLQLGRLELQQAVREELEENPALEELSDGSEESEAPSAEEAREAAAGEGDPPAPDEKETPGELIDRIDWDYYFGDSGPSEGGGGREHDDEDGRPFYENTLTAGESLADHLRWQLGLSTLRPALVPVAEYLIGNVDENGYLGVTVEETAESLSVTTADVEEALAFVQSLDPPGVAGRDLREVLLIQARQLGEEFALAARILEEAFEPFAKRDVPGVARRLHLPEETVREALRQVVTLSPKPGRGFSADDTHTILPDAHVFKVDDNWVVTLNEEGQPRIRLSAYYRRLLQKGDEIGKEDREFLRQKLNSALWFIKSIEQRQRTIYKTVESIMKLQRDFLERGPKHLRPLTLRDVAEDIGMHESTVSRVTSGKYVATPHGTFELKYFFNSGLSRDGGEETIASKSVKEKIREIVEREGGRSLSDQELMRLLREQGIQIARRTVTKYRNQLGLLSASKRKRVF